MSRWFDLLGPILAGELVQIARRRRYFLARVFVGCLLLTAVYLSWSVPRKTRGLSAMAGLAQNVSEVILFIQIPIAMALAGILLCDSISSERRALNFEILFTTDVGHREIVLGKFFSRLVVIALLLLSSLPVLSLMSLFGAIDPWHVLLMNAAALISAALVGAVTLYFSARTESPVRALIGSIFRLPPVLLMISVFSAIPSMFLTMAAPLLPAWFPLTNDLQLGLLAVMNIGFIWIYVSGAIHRLRTEGLERIQVVKTAANDDAFHQWNEVAVERFFALRNPLWSDHWLELRQRDPLARCTIPLIIVSLILLGGSEGMIRLAGWKAWEGIPLIAGAFLPFAWWMALLPVLILSTSSAVLDRRRGFLDLLLTTPLENHEILRGVFLSSWPTLRTLLGLCWLLALFACREAPDRIYASVAMGTVCLGAVFSLGMLCSLTPGSRQIATLTTASFLAVLFAEPFLFAFLLQWNPAGRVICLLFAPLLIAWVAARWRHCVTTGFLFVTGHVWLCSVLVAPWLAARPNDAYTLLNPTRWITPFLGDLVYGSHREAIPWLPLHLYWLTFLIMIAWSWWWADRHFNRLVGRAGTPQGNQRFITSNL